MVRHDIKGTDTAGWSVAIKRQKKREHTEAGGALALDCRESGQLAVQQEVRRLIRLREPPLGQRSQRSVGTWLDPLCALGTLEDRAHQAAVDLSSVATVCQGVVLTSQCSTNPKDDTLGHQPPSQQGSEETAQREQRRWLTGGLVTQLRSEMSSFSLSSAADVWGEC
ncbi:hypothetical protein Q8A67_013698 [Cirrhinus molitorella]|uniref:Uncharacterized protein n=1 Tax=Cirrhinus molitorella TaxID=172907 RepID=A0AA88TKV0_9TELE|nr:hypothetical protein Q8A67_013698 [Cirrhinus molitorella]